MNKTDLQNDYLLHDQGILYLPESIESNVLETFAPQLTYAREIWKETPIRLYCLCSGGDVDAAMAMVNLIRRDGNVHGHLIGDSCSAGTTLWAACAKRFVYPKAMIGVHQVSWRASHAEYNTDRLRALLEQFEGYDRATCEILAEASNASFDWWWEFYNRPGDVKWLRTEQIIELGMASPLQRVHV